MKLLQLIWAILKNGLILQKKAIIDSQTEKLFEIEKQYWRAIIETVIKIVKFLGE